MYPRWLWPLSALPGVVWLLILFLLPLYAVLALAFGSVDPILLSGVPAWNPLDWNPGWISHVLDLLVPGNILWDVFLRTCRYVVISLAGCILIGYPVAYWHQQRAAPPRHHLRPEQLPQRAELHRDPRADLRLYPLLHPPALRLARPHRPIPPGSGPRPRRDPVPGVLARHAAAVEDRPARRRRADHAADVRRLLHAEHRVGRAVHVDDRKPD